MPLQARPLPLRRHGRQACHAGTARQGQEHGLDLVVRVLGQCYGFDSFWRLSAQRYGIQSLVPGLPGRVFRALAGRGPRIQAADGQRHVQVLAQGHAVVLEAVGGCLQAMVHVDGPHLAGPASRAGQQ